jgi:hypothetical protein
MTWNKILCGGLLMTLTLSCGKKSNDDDAPPPPVTPPSDDPKPKVPDKFDFEPPVTDAEVRLRGFQELSSIVASNLLQDQSTFSLAHYLDESNIGLVTLLGYYESNPVDPGWRNVNSNSMNATVALMAFESLGKDLAQVCSPGPSKGIQFRSDVVSHVQVICAHGAKSSDDELKLIWSDLSGGLLPESEFAPWLVGVRDSSQSWEAGERFSFMTSTVFGHPVILFKN